MEMGHLSRGEKKVFRNVTALVMTQGCGFAQRKGLIKEEKNTILRPADSSSKAVRRGALTPPSEARRTYARRSWQLTVSDEGHQGKKAFSHLLGKNRKSFSKPSQYFREGVHLYPSFREGKEIVICLSETATRWREEKRLSCLRKEKENGKTRSFTSKEGGLP